LQQAVDGWAEADTIEIRTDGPVEAATLQKAQRPMLIRSAPGYLPVIKGILNLIDTNRVSFEGIHFAVGGLENHFSEGTVARIANCSFDNAPTYFAMRSFFQNGNEPALIVNSIMQAGVNAKLRAGQKLIVRNSYGTLFTFESTAKDLGVEFDRCVVWNPDANGPNSWVLACHSQTDLPKIAFVVSRTLFEVGYCKIAVAHEDFIASWTGSRNVYRGTFLGDWLQLLQTKKSSDAVSLSVCCPIVRATMLDRMAKISVPM
jgi:hypothetical protein